VVKLLLALMTAAGPPPSIFWASQPVRAGQTVMVSGAGFGPGAALAMQPLPDDDTKQPFDGPEFKLGTPRRVEPSQVADSLLMAEVPELSGARVFNFCVAAGDRFSEPRLLNVPEVWFLQGDQGQTASPGGWLAAFGNCLSLGGERRPQMLLAHGRQPVALLKARAADGTGYGQYFDVPANCPAGTYEVWLHNGYGGGAAWVKFAGFDRAPITTVTVAPAPDWPTDIFVIPGPQAGGDDARFAAAIAAAKAAGGGIIGLPAGEFKLTGALALPPRTLLMGAGKDRTKLVWTADPKDAGGRPLPLVRGADLARRRGMDYRAEFSVADLSLIASPTFTGRVVERVGSTEPAYLRNVAMRTCVPTDGTALFLSEADNTEISGCDLDARDGFMVYGFCRGTRFAGSTIRWRGNSVQLARDWYGVIFEHNRLVMAGTFKGNGFTEAQNPNPGVSLAGYDGTNGHGLYWAHNISDREEAEPPHRSIGITLDGTSQVYCGQLAKVEGTHLTLAGATHGPDQYKHQPARPGSPVQIIAGRGAGQWRHLTSAVNANVNAIDIDRPFDVEPDASSWIGISNDTAEMLFVANDLGNDPLLQTYFGIHDVIWAENRIGVRGKRVEMPNWVEAARSGWHYQVLDNQIRDLGVETVTPFPGWETPKTYLGPLTGTHVYRGNKAEGQAARFVINLPNRAIGVLIEGNLGLSEIRARKVTECLGLVHGNSDAKGQQVVLATAVNGMLGDGWR
jgi:hypothetical protein